MARTLLAYAAAAGVVASAWVALERGAFPVLDVVVVCLLALLPGLAVSRGAGRIVVVLTVAIATLLAAGSAFGIPLTDARPRDAAHDFFGPVLSGFREGFLQFWDNRVPIDAAALPLMHGVILLAVFGFAAGLGVAIAGRRPLLALALLLIGAGWPATMASTAAGAGRPLLFGAVILAAALALLVLLRPGNRGLAHAGVVGLALVLVAVAGSTTDAVAKRGFVDWNEWDLYDEPDDPVSVRYVWESNYDGISYPEEKTTVLKVKTSGPRRSLYWRATTLDDYTSTVWRENLTDAVPFRGGDTIAVPEYDPLLPEAAAERENWVRQDVTIEALEDSRLVGSGQAARWELASPGDVGLFENGAVVQDRPVERDQRYTVWSYVPPVKPKELNGAGTSYAPELDRYLRAQPSFDLAPLPPYGTPGRERRLNALFLQESYMADHRVLWDAARRVAAEAATPYQAAVAVEAWFRGEEGGFVYDESPPFAGTAAPLPFFLESKRGYCQHFAGAMALMLRYLGIPARVAAGFTSGTYDQRTKEWTVTDHNAHTWVEVYFPRFGWIPFDPTPNRGELSASYSPFSPAFDAAEAAGLGEGFGSIPEVAERIDRAAGLEQREGASSGGGAGGGVPGAVAETGGSILGGLLLLVLGAGALIVLVKEARRRARFAARDPRALAAACRRDLAGYLADQGVAVPTSATPRELGEIAERALGVDPRRFVGALAEARYGPPPEARSCARRARTELRRLRGSMRHRLGAGQRLRGALSLRSLSV